ncbi:ABC transporter permease [Solicola gregarius]|uniref:ABC transporter permease subunit n=1 Tax=Solicola gregarius TaxID=2908642 RepID=A0AA46YNM7_9ACTN|nr:ABC transporter permease subunit [Solicola gregarius]UYM07784.1 ABC transporter permease subunit [Solicola gregarius]
MAAVDQTGTMWSGPRYKQEAAQKRTGRSQYLLISVGSVLTVLILWWLITALDLVDPLFVPTPASVWDSFVTALTDGYRGRGLLVHLAVSLQRLFVALALAVVIAVPLGVLVGFSRRLEAALEPLINFYRVLPPLAYYPLLIIWMGISEVPKVTLLFLAGFAPLFISVVQGVRNVSKGRLDAARSLGASDRQVMRYVVLPSILPDLFTGLRVAIGFTYTTLVAAEMVAATVGIGWMVLDAGRYLQSDIVFMGIIVMGITGIALDSLAKYAQRRIVPWQGKG